MGTVGYGDYTVRSNEARTLMILAGILGIFLNSMLVVSFIHGLTMNHCEKNAFKIIEKVNYRHLTENTSKIVINIFRKILKSDISLRKTVLLETTLYKPLKNAIKILNRNISDEKYIDAEVSGELQCIRTIVYLLKRAGVIEEKHKKIENHINRIMKKLDNLSKLC